MNLIHIHIHCNIVDYVVNLKHCAFHSVKRVGSTLLTENIMLNSSIIFIACQRKKNMPSYLL